MDLQTEQLAYELKQDAQAAADKLEALRLAAAQGDLEIPRTSRFIAMAYTAVRASLEAEMLTRTRGMGGKFKGWLRAVPLDVASVISIREIIAACMDVRSKSAVTLQVLAKAIGQKLELEVRIAEAEAVNPVYMRKIREQLQERGTTAPHHLRAVYNVAYNRIMKGEIDSKLTETETMHLGKFGVQACLNAGILEQERAFTGKGLLVTYKLPVEVMDYLTDYDESDVSLVTDTAAMAMRCPPEPWTNLTDGGYLSTRRKAACPLMGTSTIRKSMRKEVRAKFTAEHMPQVFAAANYLQSIPYTMHQPTMDAIRNLWESGGGVMGVPSRREPQKPAFPFPDTWTKEEASAAELQVFTRWKLLCVLYYDDLRKWRGKVREISGFFRATQENLDRFWFPVFFDKRGRWYYRGSPNPQGSDLAKGVLHFADKKALGREGVFWLKVHIATSLGFDKERPAARAAWLEGQWSALERALDAPGDYPEVWGKDARWCAYSAAWELREAYRSGNPETYETGIPAHQDATCSGLQHFSALLRDPVGGLYVNLVDTGAADGPKQDIYSKVSTWALEAAKRDVVGTDPEKARYARWWLDTGVERAAAKKPVMTYVYGATLLGTAQWLTGYVTAEMPDAGFPPEENPLDYTLYMARLLFAGIAATVPAAAAAMKWLRKVSQQMGNGQRMAWIAPSGFWVQHDYQDYEETRVRVESCGVRLIVVREYTEGTQLHKMQNAVSPNFVHALDASHLTLTALGMQDLGLAMVGIHDSFGTHPSDVSLMHKVLREKFVSMYKDGDLLINFLWEVGGVGEAPKKGSLNLDDVLTSEFFFC